MSEGMEPAAKGGSASAVAAGLFVTVFCLLFAGLALLPVHVPVYIPLEHRWQIGFPAKPAVGMDFFGRVLYAWLGAALCAAAGWALAKKLGALKPQAVRLLAIYCYASVALAVFIYCYVLLFK